MPIFDINADIRFAETLAADFYTEEKYFAASKEKIFAQCPQFVGFSDEISNIKPLTLLPEFLAEPLLLTKNESGKTFCLSNVCTHRGNILAETACEANLLRCRYHGRRFGLDGKFLSMPEFEETANFPGAKDDLPQIEINNWQQFLFVTLNPTANFDDFFGAMQARLNWLNLREFKFAPEFSRDYEVKAHWALYCENYLEGFHIPFVHPTLNNLIDYGTYTTELFRFSNLQLGLAKTGESCFDLPANAPDFGKKVAAFYFFVFPNLMFNFYPWGLSLNVVEPQTLEKTCVRFLTFIADKTKFGDAFEALHQTELEDEAVVENVQKGIKSRFYERGRYSPKRETGTHHFHRLIAEFMTEN